MPVHEVFRFSLFLIFPASAESLHYTINWPSGLSLGEATLSSDRISDKAGGEKTNSHWDFALDIDASVPGFVIRDHYESTAGNSAMMFALHVSRRSTLTANTPPRSASRSIRISTPRRAKPVGGGTADVSISSCARDALTFLQFARSELAQGRLAPQQTVLLGAAYEVRLEYTGTQTISVGDKKMEADRVLATITRSRRQNLTVEIFFARDAARTPLLAKMPLALGTFTVELQR